MAALQYESVWPLISKYRFTDNRNEGLSCIICNLLMVDACQSLCKCHYCYQCAVDYIGNGDVYCPGIKEDCRVVHLTIGVNVIRNDILNQRIIKVMVNCPNRLCEINCELKQLGDHLRVCPQQLMKCPFSSIGCESEGTTEGTMVAHLSSDALSHTKSLMEWIGVVKNEVEGLKHKVVTLETDLVNRENEIRTLQIELVNVRNLSEIRLPEAMRELAVQRGDIDGVRTIVNEVRNYMNEMKGRDARNETRVKQFNNLVKWNKLLCPNIDADFVWRIEECSKKIDTPLFSESFYANNYKLCLYVYNSSNDNIGLMCRLVRGHNDERVAWPMRQSVTLSIIDQCTLSAHKSDTFKFDTWNDKSAYNKPIGDRNECGIGSSSFIKYSTIKHNQSITANDCIVVSCTVTAP